MTARIYQLDYGRRPDLDRAIDYLAQQFPHVPVTIVEIGGPRVLGNVVGDGNATIAFLRHIDKHGGFVYSIDVTPETVATAAGLGAYALLGDAAGVLEGMKAYVSEIHFLYLDGSNDPAEALAQLHAAWPLLTPGAMVMCDDFGTKGPMVAEWLNARRDVRRFQLPGKWDMAAWRVRI